MKLLFTLDYELFMGNQTGTADHCLINPLDQYLEATRNYGLRFTLFVDAAYLFALRSHMAQHECLRNDFRKITHHLRTLHDEGHDIQLHIHPQWYYSEFDGTVWHLDTNHYKLTDMPKAERIELVKESKELLDSIVGKQTMAFRAGGFSAQPSEALTEIFDTCGLTTDSSVCPGERYDSHYQQYDYSHVDRLQAYRFSTDLCVEDNKGDYTECPLSMYDVSPLFHWRLLAVRLTTKLTRNTIHNTFGDGHSVRTTKASILHRLTHTCQTIATIDGYKISFLKEAIDYYQKHGFDTMCILGHPKLATPYSVARLPKICEYAQSVGHKFITLSELSYQTCQG